MATASLKRTTTPRGLPLVVDLDGTLIASDSLFESLLELLKQQPHCLLLLPVWFLKGKAALKSEIASRFQLRAETLPYRQDILAYLRAERESGRTLILATAAHHTIADAVSAHLKIFDEVLATDRQVNRKGIAKRDALVERFGMRGFDYLGDHRADVLVWGASRIAHVAGNQRNLPELAHQAGAKAGQSFVSVGPSFRSWTRAIRVHQWVKNLLLFVPLAMAHRLDARATITVAIGFLAFSFLASGTYLVNDLLDLEADRKHPSKRSRPFASGEIPLTQGVVIAPLLILVAFGLGISLGPRPLVHLLLYFVVTLAYSARLKHRPIVDVIALAFLYTLRILAGGAIAAVPISQWLFQFSVFLFLSLALVKRFSEIHRLQLEGKDDVRARGYRSVDLTIVSQAGICAGLIAALVLALYINGPDVQLLYRKPHVLWAVCPIFVYWIVRVWLVANRGGMNEDPILFALRDRVSYFAAFAILFVVLLATLYAH